MLLRGNRTSLDPSRIVAKIIGSLSDLSRRWLCCIWLMRALCFQEFLLRFLADCSVRRISCCRLIHRSSSAPSPSISWIPTNASVDLQARCKITDAKVAVHGHGRVIRGC